MAFYEIFTPSTDEPIKLSEAKLHLRVDHSEEDALITALIQAAREIVEERTNRKMLPTVIKEYYDSFSCTIDLRWSPVKEISSVRYYDTDNSQVTMQSTDYHAEINSEPATVTTTTTWPSTYTRKRAVTVQYTAGYSDAAAVPAYLKQAMLLLIAEMYETRENTVKRLPTAVDHLLTQAKVWV